MFKKPKDYLISGKKSNRGARLSERPPWDVRISISFRKHLFVYLSFVGAKTFTFNLLGYSDWRYALSPNWTANGKIYMKAFLQY